MAACTFFTEQYRADDAPYARLCLSLSLFSTPGHSRLVFSFLFVVVVVVVFIRFSNFLLVRLLDVTVFLFFSSSVCIALYSFVFRFSRTHTIKQYEMIESAFTRKSLYSLETRRLAYG